MGLIGSDEKIVTAEDRAYERGGAECFFSAVKVVVETDSKEHDTRYAVAKAWVGRGKGRRAEDKRSILMASGLKVVDQYGHIPSTVDSDGIAETVQRHASPVAFEAGERVKSAKEAIADLTEEDGHQIGAIAAILDMNRFSPTRVLEDVLMTDEGPRFNDFGYDLGEQGPETSTRYGYKVTCDYDRGAKCLERELLKSPPILAAAQEGYEAQMSKAGKK